jgi:transcriptional regulator of arginine metabolism
VANPKRLRFLRQILRSGQYRSQSALVRELRGRGIQVSQSSISRDLLELGAIKRGGCYVLPGEGTSGRERDFEELASIWRDLVMSIAAAGPNLLVVRTRAGSANAIGHCLDQVDWPEIIGTLAGDDTIFIAVGSEANRNRLQRHLSRLGRAE